MDVTLPCQFATWTFRTFGRFDTRTFRYIPGCFVTYLKVSNLQYSKTSLSSGSETSTEVLVSKRPKVRNVQVAKRPCGELAKSETSCYLKDMTEYVSE